MNGESFIRKAVAVGLVTLMAGAASAKDRGQHERNTAAALAKARVVLSDAIGSAERQTGGRAVGASLEDGNGALRYEVHVVTGNDVQDVFVDALTGSIVTVAAAGDHHHGADDRD
jgi:uncharacterized membrane protein YkoI